MIYCSKNRCNNEAFLKFKGHFGATIYRCEKHLRYIPKRTLYELNAERVKNVT